MCRSVCMSACIPVYQGTDIPLHIHLQSNMPVSIHCMEHNIDLDVQLSIGCEAAQVRGEEGQDHDADESLG